jgi:hypothetical protein
MIATPHTGAPRTRRFRRLHSCRGGVLLDAVLAVLILGLAAFALNSLGISFHQIVHGIAHFVGS